MENQYLEALEEFSFYWTKMLKSSKKLEAEGISFKFNVTLSSSDELEQRRKEIIKEVNKGFTKNEFNFESDVD